MSLCRNAYIGIIGITKQRVRALIQRYQEHKVSYMPKENWGGKECTNQNLKNLKIY